MTNFGLSPSVIEHICSVMRHHPLVESAAIYGSRARGDYKNYSDIDIAIHAPGMSLDEYMDIRDELRQLPVIFKIDSVHVEDCSKQELLANIKRDEKKIYVKG